MSSDMRYEAPATLEAAVALLAGLWVERTRTREGKMLAFVALLVLPVIGALLVGGAGLFGTRRALNVSPLRVLREN